jgi:hypothetical protein
MPSYSLMTLFYAGFYPWCLKFVFSKNNVRQPPS